MSGTEFKGENSSTFDHFSVHSPQLNFLCLQEFWDQLKSFEEELPYVSQLAVDGLLKEHEQKLSCATSNIQHSFHQQLEDWRSVKVCVMDASSLSSAESITIIHSFRLFRICKVI